MNVVGIDDGRERSHMSGGRAEGCHEGVCWPLSVSLFIWPLEAGGKQAPTM